MSIKTTPDLRAEIIAGILRHVAETPEPVSYSAVSSRALEASRLPEEEIGEAIMHAASHLIFSGLLNCDGFDQDLGQITFGHGATISAGPRLLGFIWEDYLPNAEPDTDGEGGRS